MKNGITYERHKKQSLNIGTSSANLLISWNVLQCRRIDWNQLYFHGECVCYKRLCLKKILRQCKRLRALIFMIWVRRKSWFKTSFGSNLYFRENTLYIRTAYQAFKLGSYCSLDEVILQETLTLHNR